MAEIAPDGNPITPRTITQEDLLRACRLDNLYNHISATVAVTVEMKINHAASNSRHFVHGINRSTNLGMVLVSPPEDWPVASDTDRTMTLHDRYHASTDKIVIPIAIKTLRWKEAKIDEGGREYTLLECAFTTSREKKELCPVVIFGNIDRPDVIAVFPMMYFSNDGGSQHDEKQTMHFEPVVKRVGEIVSLPMELSPFVMPVRRLPEAIDNIAAAAADPSVKLMNPHLNLEYPQQPRLLLRALNSVTPITSPEAAVRLLLWKAFRAHGNAYTFHNLNVSTASPQFALQHNSRASVIIELKHGECEVKDLPNGGIRLEHKARSTPKFEGTFTVMATWDYLLTMMDDHKGYLIAKKDIPGELWHRFGEDNVVHADFVDAAFLDQRQINLNGSHQSVVDTIVRVMGTGSADHRPWEIRDFIRHAGVMCPKELVYAFDSKGDVILDSAVLSDSDAEDVI